MGLQRPACASRDESTGGLVIGNREVLTNCVCANSLYQQQPAASGSQMSRCLQLVSLESRHNYWTDCPSPAAGEIHTVCMYICIYR